MKNRRCPRCHTHYAAPARYCPSDGTPLVEVEALRAQLQEALSRTSKVLALLKQQRQQRKAVDAAMASLRKLGQFDR